MPSSYSASLRFEKQFTGENVNTWGDRLNTLFERADFSIAGLQAIALTGDHALTTSNTLDDEARAAILKFTGGAGTFTITAPAVSKIYKVWNATAGILVMTTGAGATVSIDPGDIVEIFCDGIGVKTIGYGGSALKDYIASVVVGGGSALPSVVGQANKFLTNNGTIPNWSTFAVANLSDYVSDQAAKKTVATNLAAALAVAL
jgi:hypothetical protein